MKIIYCCYGGTHSSPVAAAIHLGNLPRDRAINDRDLLNTALFDRVTAADRGKLFFAGKDRFGHEVYVMGRGSEPKGIKQALLDGIRLAGVSDMDIMFVDTLKCVNFWMRVGGYLSRAAGLVRIGRPIVLFGTRRAYHKLQSLVEMVERKVAR